MFILITTLVIGNLNNGDVIRPTVFRYLYGPLLHVIFLLLQKCSFIHFFFISVYIKFFNYNLTIQCILNMYIN
jgi:hypothetical protein